MGLFGKIASFAGGVARKFGEVGKAAIGKLGVIKSSYDNINNAAGGAVGSFLEGLPFGIGGALKGIGKFLDHKESIGMLTNTLDHLRVYGQDFEKVGNRLLKEGR
jgi:ethanolamine ammonia-lyase large subunit